MTAQTGQLLNQIYRRLSDLGRESLDQKKRLKEVKESEEQIDRRRSQPADEMSQENHPEGLPMLKRVKVGEHSK